MTKLPKIYKSLKDNNLDTIDAGWRKFKLIFVENLKDEHDKLFGITDFDKYEISLEKNVSEETAQETIIHELTHLILETHGLGDYGKEDDPIKLMKNEEMTLLISRGLLQLHNLNQGLFKILFNNE